VQEVCAGGIAPVETLGHESLDTLKHYARLTITDLKKTHSKCPPWENEG
jgi:site-specific recombinase XerD